MFSSHLVSLLKRGGIAVIPTDTLYGIVASSRNRDAVARLYRLRRSTPKKPFIVLIPAPAALHEFGFRPSVAQTKFLKTVWSGKVSVILSCTGKRFSYLHLGTETLAFRVPKPAWLRALLKKTGPLLAPSANREGEKPAETIREARHYFGNSVDWYVSAGRRLRGKPSTLVSFVGNEPSIIRTGAVRVTW